MERQELKQQIKELLYEMGKIYYEEHKRDNKWDEKYADLFSKLNTLNAELAQFEDEELKAQGLKKCPDCHCKVVLESNFCNMCGHSFVSKKEQNVNVVEEPVIKKCRVCGVELEDEAAFCSNCGQRQ